MAAKRAKLEERLALVRAIGARAGAAMAMKLKACAADASGVVVAEVAKLAVEHELTALAPDLEQAFARLLVDPAKSDPGCRGKLEVADALRRLGARADEVFNRGLRFAQMEPGYPKPADAAGPLRVACAAAILESRRPFGVALVASLLADEEPSVRSGTASVLGTEGTEAAEALLRLKASLGDRDSEVTGACLAALVRSSLERNLAFVLERMVDAPEATQELALLALGESRSERALEPLRAYAEAESKDVRGAAMIALSVSRLPAANAFLLDRVAHAAEKRALEALRALVSQRYDRALVASLGASVKARGGPVEAAFQRDFEG